MPTPSGRSAFINADAAPRAAGGLRGAVDHRPAPFVGGLVEGLIY